MSVRSISVLFDCCNNGSGGGGGRRSCTHVAGMGAGIVALFRMIVLEPRQCSRSAGCAGVDLDSVWPTNGRLYPWRNVVTARLEHDRQGSGISSTDSGGQSLRHGHT